MISIDGVLVTLTLLSDFVVELLNVTVRHTLLELDDVVLGRGHGGSGGGWLDGWWMLVGDVRMGGRGLNG